DPRATARHSALVLGRPGDRQPPLPGGVLRARQGRRQGPPGRVPVHRRVRWPLQASRLGRGRRARRRRPPEPARSARRRVEGAEPEHLSLFPVMMDQQFQDMFEVNLGVELSYAQKRKCTLKVLTSNFRTQEGSRPSCVIENEIHHWVYSKGGDEFHSVMGRNLNKRGEADVWARRIMITNAYKPSEESVARTIREGWEDGLAGRAVDTGRLLYDSIEV